MQREKAVVAAAEEHAAAEAAAEAEAIERQQQEARLEDKLICAAQQAEAAQENLEEGEISEVERLRRYYKRAIEVAADYALYAEGFSPCLRQINEYPDYLLRAMCSQNQSALLVFKDVICERWQKKEPYIRWHGPVYPADLPDFEREVERKHHERR